MIGIGPALSYEGHPRGWRAFRQVYNCRRIHGGLACGYFGLLLSLTTLNLLVFYFDQFGAVGTALLDFAALIGLVRYRRRLRATPGSLRRRELRGRWHDYERQPVA